MAGDSDLVVTLHFTCCPAGLGRQDTQALHLNPMCLLIDLNFCFWTVSLHGAEIRRARLGGGGGALRDGLWPRVDQGSWKREFGLHGNLTWVPKDLGSSPASAAFFSSALPGYHSLNLSKCCLLPKFCPDPCDDNAITTLHAVLSQGSGCPGLIRCWLALSCHYFMTGKKHIET